MRKIYRQLGEMEGKRVRLGLGTAGLPPSGSSASVLVQTGLNLDTPEFHPDGCISVTASFRILRSTI